ncbi:18S rRNA maturation protein [Arthrobotrys megalospora]
MSTQIHPSRLPQIPTQKKRKRPSQKPPKPQPASTSLSRSQLRKKIRDLTRLLNVPTTTTTTSTNTTGGTKSKLPATTRLEHERALSAYKHELHLQQTSTKRQTLEKRYHKVRFFERRKATRALSRLTRELAAISPEAEDEDDEKKKELQNKIHNAEVDLNYIMHYPPLEKYISLYKSGDNKDTNDKRERIRLDIEKRMEEGTLDKGNALVEANAAEGFGGGSDGKKNKKDNNNNKKSKGKSIPEEADEDDEDEGSDGGFFEF